MAFKFLYSALMACLFGLVNQSTIGAITFFVLAFMIGLLIPERTRQPTSFKPTRVSVIFLVILLVLTVIWTASIPIKMGAWLILLIIYLLEKIEKTY
ncbi:hypothetical protein PU629_01170 [Pullulanibacillus sp. KACC 23026]|uniref:hypothetical protein n=1 Tax=Pullulanibacillus sp. KACC 23026 TaxID=3028315 RepID=UPI0023B1A7A4|nr:hypothetical protein [Pullulanibacillus sp. KACC 23026]WEG12998.1 hypothetical protein PU629_01170 [Pullulanibacillus sp. KACC 23026]